MRKVYLLFVLAMLFLHISAEAYADTAKSVCVMNTVTGEVVFEKNSDEKLPMASTTKIMTLLTALEKTEPEDMVTISFDAANTEGSSAYLEAGAQMTMNDLEYGLMLNSGNDAAVAIAEHISGDTASFAEEMNKLARKIGVKNSCFKNPNGLDEEGHYTTAYDLAKITQYALCNERFREIVSSRIYEASMIGADGGKIGREYINHNRLLRELEGCIGVKTGFTKNDGRCLVSAAERDGAGYIVVTLNDSNDWNDHKELMELAFSGTRIVRAVSAGDCVAHLKSSRSSCGLVAAADFNVPLNGDRGRDIKIIKHIPDIIDAPLNKGEKAGYIEIICNDVIVGTTDIVADRDFYTDGEIKKKTCFGFTIINLIKNLL